MGLSHGALRVTVGGLWTGGKMRYARIVSGWGMFALGLAASTASAQFATQYSIIDLGPGSGYAVNESGQVAGLTLTGFSFEAFRYSNGVKTPLGRFGYQESRAWGMNNLGTVAGRYGGPGGQSNFAFTWADGSGVTLPMFNAYDINDSNQVIGEHVVGQDVSAAIYQNGSFTELGTLGGDSSIPWGINNAGKVVGRARDASDIDRAFVWTNGTMTPLLATSSEAHDINELDQIVGRIDLGSGLHRAVIWNIGVMTNINPAGVLDSTAYGINDDGVVVGYAGRAFIWSQGQSAFLNDLIPSNSGWGPLRSAHAINNAGQIVGDGEINGVMHAFLMTPIPEPAVAGWLIVVPMLGRARRSLSR